MSDDEIRLLAVHPVLWDAIVEWAEHRGLLVLPIPHEEGELATYIFSPKNFDG